MLRKRSPCARHRGVWGSESTAPLIRNLNTRWRWTVSLMRRERSQGIYWKWGWVRTRYDLDALNRKLISCPSQETNIVTFSGNVRHTSCTYVSHHNFVARYTIFISCILNFQKDTVQHLAVLGSLN